MEVLNMKKSIIFLHSYHNMNTKKIGVDLAKKGLF